MIFAPVKTAAAEGAILAHSLSAGDRRLRKGRVLSRADIAALERAGIEEITVARLQAQDIHEDKAALQLARALVGKEPQGLRLSKAFTGRVNIHATQPGLVRLNSGSIDRFNSVDPSITVATLRDFSRVAPRALVATVKIIPFAAQATHVQTAATRAGGVITLAPFIARRAGLILTRTPGTDPPGMEKARRVLARRLARLGLQPGPPQIVDHRPQALCRALRAAADDPVLILTASATSDVNDVAPAALVAAGGRLIRFGMPVDPGNLLFLGELGGKTVVGLPGCVRSPALNGADWVLERLAAGMVPSADDIAAMGVGGLLKEISLRPQPRAAPIRTGKTPEIEVVLLGAGASRRMGRRDKLLEKIDGETLLHRTARVARAANVARVHVVIPRGHRARARTLKDLDVHIVENAHWAEGMSASLRAGIGALSETCDGVIVALADMPDVTPAHLNRLISAFDPGKSREICRALSADGRPGHPVLFGRRFFEPLNNLQGDRGARELLQEAAEFAIDVPTPGQGAVNDLDTPEDWRKWRAG